MDKCEKCGGDTEIREGALFLRGHGAFPGIHCPSCKSIRPSKAFIEADLKDQRARCEAEGCGCMRSST